MMLARIGAATVTAWAGLLAYGVYVALRPGLHADTCAHLSVREAGMPEECWG